MVLSLLEFFFQDFSHWLGGLIYLGAGTMAFGIALGLIAEIFTGKK